MNLLCAYRVPVYGERQLFEELEERIVLDASIDPTIHHDPLGSSDTFPHWNLEYSSDPSVSMDHVLDTHDLGAYPADLGTPLPSITLGIVPATNGAAYVDLSGAARIDGSPTAGQMYCAVTFNPRPLSSCGIQALNFAESTLGGVTVDRPVPDPTQNEIARTWHFRAQTDSINAILATMQAAIKPGFVGTAEIDITLTDPDLVGVGGAAGDVTKAPLITRTIYIPCTQGLSTYGPMVANPGSINAPAGVGAAGVFGGVQVADMRAQVVDVGLSVYHGTIGDSDAIPGVQVVRNPSSVATTATPPGTPDGDYWVPSWLYVRGNLTDINTYINNLTYTHLDGYGTAGDRTADDLLEVQVDDRGTNANPFWRGDPLKRSASVSIPIYY